MVVGRNVFESGHQRLCGIVAAALWHILLIGEAAAAVVGKHAGHGQFGLRRFGQRYSYGVADAFAEQGTYADSRFYASILAVAGLGYSEVERKVHVFGIHGANQKAYGFDHHLHVGGLD